MRKELYGRQPVADILNSRGIYYFQAAEACGVKKTHLENCLYGLIHPSPAVRDNLPVFLGLPLSELFTEASLAVEYDQAKGSQAPGDRQNRLSHARCRHEATYSARRFCRIEKGRRR